MAARETISATRAAVEVLKAAGKPLSSKEIIDGVLERKDVNVTSRSSIQASIFTAEKNGRLFKRVSKGVYKLHPKVDEQLAKPAKAEAKPAEAKAEAKVDENDVDLKKAAAAADEASKASAQKRSAKPDPKPKKRDKAPAAA